MSLARLFRLSLAVFLLAAGAGHRALAVDPLADAAVDSLAKLTDPHRLEALSEDNFRAQLGPALGWLHVARKQDVAPEAVIARAFAQNGLSGERARLTREALLRNLARADAWELFAHDDTALALANGRPAQIPTGIHRGHLAAAAVILPEGLAAADQREFACLVLRADDEMPIVPRPKSKARATGDMLAKHSARRTKPSVDAAPDWEALAISYDDPLPAH